MFPRLLICIFILVASDLTSTYAIDEDYAPGTCNGDGTCEQEDEVPVDGREKGEKGKIDEENEKTIFKKSANILEEIKEHGEPQNNEGPDAKNALDVIESTLEYMRNLSKSNPEALKGCRNLDKNCAIWAAIDECNENCSFMKKNCAPSCLMCDSVCEDVGQEKIEIIEAEGDPLTTIAKYGVPQKVDGDLVDKTTAVIEAAIDHMRDLQKNPPLDFKKCRNNNELCSFWSAKGECDNNEKYMLRECAPSCLRCDSFENVKKDSTPKENKGEEELVGQFAEIAKYGVPQEVHGSDEKKTLAVIDYVIRHMKSLEESPPSDFEKCRNNHRLCSFWAGMGECDNSQKFMFVECGPSCLSCDSFHENVKKYTTTT